MGEAEQAAESLRRLAQSQRLVERAFENCSEYLRNLAADDQEAGVEPLSGFQLAEIRLEFERQALVFAHGILAYPFVETLIGLYVSAKDRTHFPDQVPIGTYRFITMPDGEVDDDYLELTETKERLVMGAI